MQRRLTDDEESHLRAAWSVLQKITKPWEEISRLQRAIWEMVANSTTNGLRYIEPPLTDEDARARPWVMVRDREDHEWSGPRRLAMVTAQSIRKRYHILANDGESFTSWMQCRRATLAELAAAGLEVTE
jgi:hypothetical protein